MIVDCPYKFFLTIQTRPNEERRQNIYISSLISHFLMFQWNKNKKFYLRHCEKRNQTKPSHYKKEKYAEEQQL